MPGKRMTALDSNIKAAVVRSGPSFRTRATWQCTSAASHRDLCDALHSSSLITIDTLPSSLLNLCSSLEGYVVNTHISMRKS